MRLLEERQGVLGFALWLLLLLLLPVTMAAKSLRGSETEAKTEEGTCESLWVGTT